MGTEEKFSLPPQTSFQSICFCDVPVMTAVGYKYKAIQIYDPSFLSNFKSYNGQRIFFT